MWKTLEGVILDLKEERGSGEQRKELDISSKGRKRHRNEAGTGAAEAECTVPVGLGWPSCLPGS